MTESTRHRMLLFAICGVTYLVNLGGTHLWDVDEAYFSRTAQEMEQRGDLIVPYFNGEISLHKPVLMYWVMIASTKLFGVTEFAARIGSAVFAIFNVLLTYQLGCRLFSRSVGLWSGLVLSSCVHFVLIARAAVVDQELMFFCTLPIFIFVCSTRLGGVPNSFSADSEPIRGTDVPWSRWALAYGSMGIGTLAKGPVAVVLPSAVIGLFLLLTQADFATRNLTRGLSRFKQMQHWTLGLLSPFTFLRTTWQMRPVTLIAAVCLVALPWYAAVGLRTQGEWLRGFFLVHNVARFSRSFEGHAGGMIYYLVAIAVGTFPWSIFSFQAIRQMVGEMDRGSKNRAAYQLVCSCIVVWVGAFTIASTKLPHYVIPAYPALAVLFGRFVTTWIGGQSIVSRNWMNLAFGNMIFIGVCVTAAVPVVAHIYLPGEEFLGIIGLIPLVGGIFAYRYQKQARRLSAAHSLVAIGVTLSVAVLAWAAVRVDDHQSSPRIGQWLEELEQKPGSSRFVTFGYFDPSVVYYADRKLNKYSKAADVAELFSSTDRPTYVLTTDARMDELKPLLPEGVGVLRRTSRFLKPGQLLLVGPEDQYAPRLSEAPGQTESRL